MCPPSVAVLHQQAQQAWSREMHGWSVEELRAYVIWAKATGQNLTMSTAAEQVWVAARRSAGSLHSL